MRFRTISIFLLSALFVFLPCRAAAQEAVLLDYIQHKSEIKDGGSDLFAYNGNQYLITVTSLSVGTKTEQQCKVVGSGKAKRDMIAYVNGSEITSCTELITKENVVESSKGTSAYLEQQYFEHIKETVLGTINEIKPLGGWFSKDKTVYYFAIIKTIR